MTKNFILIGVIFITGFLIVGCENKEELDYTDFESHFITEASDAFKDTEEIHIEYFYSQYCSHCQDIKQNVLHFLSKLDDTEYYIIDTSKVVNMYL
ncbi:MAG: hypothetical protein K9L74_07115 [Candidatus Izimaplasma sp.]|nr:hypothetical protein [Candidatus Izimaplasma bacterium]